MKPHFALFFLLTALSCARVAPAPAGAGVEYAQWFSLTDSSAVVHSPFGGPDDTLSTARPFTRFVCMSSSTVACLAAVGADSLVRGVSGLAFVSDPLVRARASEVGYDAQPDYETILRLQPDLLLTYTVSSAEPPAMEKLRSLGIRVVSLYDHLETHPLARAEYVRLVGALTGRRALADSVFAAVRDRYFALVRPLDPPVKVLMNIPYGDQWYIPGADNFLSRLVRDAGGTVLGAKPGPESATVSVEEAYALSAGADVWLHPGWCRTKAQLRSVHPLFADFPVLGKSVYNNTLRQTPGGGNDFWESGAVRPDLILEDLRRIFSGAAGPNAPAGPAIPADSLHYYFELR